MASRFEISGVTDQLYDSLLQRRKAVEFEKELLFRMQQHRDALALKYADMASSGGRGSGSGGRGGSSGGGWIDAWNRKNAQDGSIGDDWTIRAENRARQAESQARADEANDKSGKRAAADAASVAASRASALVANTYIQGYGQGSESSKLEKPSAAPAVTVYGPTPKAVDPRTESYDTMANWLGTN